MSEALWAFFGPNGFESSHPWIQDCNITVLCDGIDVTKRCYEFDTDQRTVGLFLVNDNGNPYVEKGEVAREAVTGEIEIRPRAGMTRRTHPGVKPR